MYNPCLLSFLGLACLSLLASGNSDEAIIGHTEIVSKSEGEKSIIYPISRSNTANITTSEDVDWTESVVVLHNRPEFRLEMGERQTILVAVSVLCETPNTRYKIFVDTMDAENGYVPEDQRSQFSLACESLLLYSITEPLVNTTEGYRSISFRLPTVSQNKTAEGIVNEWLLSSLFQSSDPKYFGSREEDVQNEWTSRAKAAAELFLEGGRDSPSPRIAQIVNLTVVADLIGRTRLRFFSVPLTNERITVSRINNNVGFESGSTRL